MKKLALHWRILIGMLLGVLFGVLMLYISGGKLFIQNWINPFGIIFINLLKLIAIPLILASIIKGISDLKDIAQFKTIGVRSVTLFITTTIVAIIIGLLLVNIFSPGKGISEETVSRITNEFVGRQGVQSKLAEASVQKESAPLQFLLDMVPENVFSAMSDNKLMLQVIFFSVFLGVSMLLIGEAKAKPLKTLFDSLNDAVLKMVDIIMVTAPFAVFALLANVVASSGDPDLLLALVKYAGVVILGLFLMIVFYCTVLTLVTRKNPIWFLKAISPAQLLAFSTSSSAATLPVTMERVENQLGVDKEVASFVLPVGATINMDGTSLYQGVAAVFISQALGHHLEITDQLMIILTALLASIGSAAVPGAGMVMLVIVLESIGFPSDKLAVGLALIFAVDRPLDMARTVINVTGDAMVSVVVAKSVGKLNDIPK
ncbi:MULTISPECIES: dicarboxylate/amino acid:cation symporter [Arenibacter]|uniref:Na+/H+-dicarboxylate symporter n=1 Tax=Arenibacter palladensis TaxID=237373 RepID=A0A1M5G8E8_9FLAO|nr:MULTISPECIES: dicarboxylate/amino acid:cation symporter [Arenibacter]MCK0135278.1 dicarboxylate/amino acid:cation symporter [Arenibacter sp. S6351L]SHF99732.1 Na+/H+-dicarboxylate symporter [Arenibacter palladensis]